MSDMGIGEEGLSCFVSFRFSSLCFCLVRFNFIVPSFVSRYILSSIDTNINFGLTSYTFCTGNSRFSVEYSYPRFIQYFTPY